MKVVEVRMPWWGDVDSPRSQLVALSLAYPPLLFLLASPCSLLPCPSHLPCGNAPMSQPHSTRAEIGRSPLPGPTSQLLPTPPRKAGHPCSAHASQHQPFRPQPWAESEVWTQAPGAGSALSPAVVSCLGPGPAGTALD